jgi:hypothetical protein
VTTDPQLESLKQWIDDENTAYSLAFAAGDWMKCRHHKKMLTQMRQRYSVLLRRNLQAQSKQQQRSA